MPDARPKIHPSIESTLSHTISTQTRIRSAFFLCRTQLGSYVIRPHFKMPQTECRGCENATLP